MELRHLRYFLAVAETCHFGQAAERLQMAQPPLSQQIRQLETELGAALFARTTRSVSLTPAGEAFLGDVRRIFRSIDDAASRARRIADGKAGTIRIGLTGTASYTHLPVLARLIKEELPGLSLDIHTEMLTRAIESGLVTGELDVGVLRPPVLDKSLATRPIAREGFVVALPEGHRFTAVNALTIGELRGEDFIMYPAELRSVVNDTVIRACSAAGYHPRVAHEAAETSTQLSLVAAGLGVAVLPDSVRGISLAGAQYRSVTGIDEIELALAWRRTDESAPVDSFLSTLEDNRIFLDSSYFLGPS
ncbi:LysR substrate-binding domain-containing protein [Arthrobacter sp. ISL-30]|uniref:LysR substrate-binding domain-containing protein n=1 Tax=Arthrobacter sp. ISL-30 TaxID=2819109 RepID=UPI001BE9107B|nr:LysR substrate-binding domain-containing protein [Arthrobacter sp. ISL-30]MBT2512434.1 LysR family transcriptional regulator [Arthrobacter sp. ISL-30]